MFIPFASIVFAGLSACSVLGLAGEFHERDGELAPLYGLEHDGCILGEYVVIFHKNYTLEQHFETIGRNFSESEGFTKFGFGYTASLDDTTLHDLVRHDPGVRLVETSREVHLIDAVDSADVEFSYAKPDSAFVKRYTQNTETGAPYGLQMIAGSGKLSTPLSNNGNYDYVHRAGQGVNVYVIDSGIRITHRPFEGRARHFGGLASDDKSPYCQDTMDDKRGHGTHVAGIIGARTFGVAPHANLINVKITNNDGTGGKTPALRRAIQDIITEHNANKAEDPDYQPPYHFRGSLINLSLAWPGNAFAILQELLLAEEAGIKVYAAAGNSNKDASDTYPCANVEAKCIAAADAEYRKFSLSNYGSAIDFIAPGDGILSLGIRSDLDLAKKSGTSNGYCIRDRSSSDLHIRLVNDQTKGRWGDYVWWNSLSGLATGFPRSTKNNLFINTGIHSKKKYDNEPFRWAGDWPMKNHEVDNEAVTATPAADAQLTTFATEFVASTVAPIEGLTDEPAVASSVAAISISVVATTSSIEPAFTGSALTSVLAALSSVTFSFDPSTPVPASPAATG
ncbi:serine protease [Vermiconidia calcicola]|uniref:Serine protease n=1 Tax=Vermiconidia calcicola TaxID=1690605 RepID=A0ACC3NKX0_9PEZI|nr:serine protease [Vermiconidia calcicola]